MIQGGMFPTHFMCSALCQHSWVLIHTSFSSVKLTSLFLGGVAMVWGSLKTDWTLEPFCTSATQQLFTLSDSVVRRTKSEQCSRHRSQNKPDLINIKFTRSSASLHLRRLMHLVLCNLRPDVHEFIVLFLPWLHSSVTNLLLAEVSSRVHGSNKTETCACSDQLHVIVVSTPFLSQHQGLFCLKHTDNKQESELLQRL